jgi:hypothetical protein
VSFVGIGASFNGSAAVGQAAVFDAWPAALRDAAGSAAGAGSVACRIDVALDIGDAAPPPPGLYQTQLRPRFETAAKLDIVLNGNGFLSICLLLFLCCCFVFWFSL